MPRTPDLSNLTRIEFAELRDMIARLQRAGGFDPRTIRLTFSPEEIARLKQLEGKVQWTAPMPATRAERPATASNVGTGGGMLMPKRIADKRRQNATSDLTDAVARLALVFDLPMQKQIDPRTDPDGLHRLEACACYLTTLAGTLEAQPVTMQIGA